MTRCTRCPHLGAVDEGAHCTLRDVPLQSPEQTWCANHPQFGDARPRRPIGPVILQTAEGARVVAPSPDDRRIRADLIDLVEEAPTDQVDRLPVRTRVALWQLQQWRERRANVFDERFDGAVTLPGAEPESGAEPSPEPFDVDSEPAPPPPTGLARMVVGLLGLQILLQLAGIWSDQLLLGAEQPPNESPGILGLADPADVSAPHLQRMLGLFMIQGLAILLTAVAFLIWYHGAFRRVRSLRPRQVDYTPGWAVGGWFIPFLNLVHVPRATWQLHRASGAGGPGGLLVGAWWSCWVLGRLIRGSSRAQAGPETSWWEHDAAVRANQVHYAVTVVAAVLAILLVWRIDRALRAPRPPALPDAA